MMVELVGSFLLSVELLHQLCQLVVELPDIGAPVSLHDLQRGRGYVAVVGTAVEEAVDGGIDIWVAKGESLVARREDNESNLSTTESAKLAGLLEKAGATL